MSFASIGPIAVYLPERIETNEDLAREFPRWDLDLIYAKTGIARRHIAGPRECASDLGVKAAQRLFHDYDIDPRSIDFLLFCTQTPDYPLPTTSCLMQDRLGLRTTCGALDFNLGCSGFIYGLAMAAGLLRVVNIRRVLLITSETYSKYIDREDRSLRTIFGDGAAATLIENSPDRGLDFFRFGTDGTGGDTLLVRTGGARPMDDALQPRHRQRWASQLYMDGPALINFTMTAVPALVDEILREAKIPKERVDFFLLHQATRKMLEQLHERMEVDERRCPIELDRCGNTVSSTIPILIRDLRERKALKPGHTTLLIGFGVGLSWGGCVWRETYPTR